MKLLLSTVLAMVLVVLVFGVSGCSWLRGSCDKAMPVLQQAGCLAADALAAVEQAQRVLDRTPEAPAELRAKTQQAIDVARAALRASNATLATLSGVCQATTPAEVFQDFIAAWDVLKPLLAQVFGMSKLGAAPGGAGPNAPPVADPLVYGFARKAPAAAK